MLKDCVKVAARRPFSLPEIEGEVRLGARLTDPSVHGRLAGSVPGTPSPRVPRTEPLALGFRGSFLEVGPYTANRGPRVF